MDSMTQEIEALKRRWETFYAQAAKPPRCVFCDGSHLWWNGSRRRAASVLIGDQVVHVEDVACRLIKCAAPECRRTWTLRPPGLAPQRHYQLCVIARATSSYLFDSEASQAGVAASASCARRTLGRWLGWLAGIASPEDLVRHLLDVSGVAEIPPLREVGALARKARTTARKAVLESAARVLCLLEALGQALSLSPPGLRSVVELVLAGRSRVSTERSPRILEFARRHLRLGGGTLPM